MAMKVMLIEDNQDILDILEYALTDNGYEVVSSTNADILTRLNLIKPDIILIDECLCDVDTGSIHCQRLKSQKATENIPVMLLSAYPHIEELAVTAKADGYIKKPFDIHELSPAIQFTLNQNKSVSYSPVH
ncbi:response regulator transcription factor [Mucilaginibacter robiniae]|uniref:Response regulator transcription factor n=1 Tax=Mucilaginibacter robiniae TaxID=2728022 RepID=A0A7L5E5R6_9SPHI|nr:response regulator [Mucilaginibacter robiniae]QJD97114.1 response regulator transcription factor [Mucilaginibacter robiniae]